MKIAFSIRRFLGPILVAPCWRNSFYCHFSTINPLQGHYKGRSRGSATSFNRHGRRNHPTTPLLSPFTTSSLFRPMTTMMIVNDDGIDPVARLSVTSPLDDERSDVGSYGRTSSMGSQPVKVFPAIQFDQLVESYGRERIKMIFLVRHAEGTHNVNRDYKSVEQLDARLTPLGVQQCEGLQNELLGWKLDRGDGRNRDVGNDDSSWESISNTCYTECDEFENDSNGNRLHRANLHYLVDGNSLDDIYVLTSTMSRCIQTALLSFEFLRQERPSNSKHHDRCQVPFVALEALRETVNYNCDRRKPISELALDYPQVDFSNCPDDEDCIWNTYQNRIQDLLSISLDSNERSEEDITRWDGHMESAELHAVAKRGNEFLDFLQRVPQSKIVVCTHSAYLRCILNWGQYGGVPRMMEQRLDDRPIEDKTRDDAIPLFDFCSMDSDEGTVISFEEYMREDYANAELRSFCLLVQA